MRSPRPPRGWLHTRAGRAPGDAVRWAAGQQAAASPNPSQAGRAAGRPHGCSHQMTVTLAFIPGAGGRPQISTNGREAHNKMVLTLVILMVDNLRENL